MSNKRVKISMFIFLTIVLFSISVTLLLGNTNIERFRFLNQNPEIQIENQYWKDNPEDNQTIERFSVPILTPTITSFPTDVSYGDYDPIDPSASKKGDWIICKDNVKVYGAPEAREDWQSGTLKRGDLVSFVTVANGHWALVSVNPVIQYVDMINICRP